ncbi:MAG: PH domain-containing protein [Lachnospiraceae bacterium]|nr:PH domain-containing protein [Lachnospiraceae bacterium]
MYEKRNPRMKTLLMVSSLISMVIVTAIAFLVLWFAVDDLPSYVDWVVYVVLILMWAYALISPFAKYYWYRAKFTDDEIAVREGFIFIKEKIVPIERLQKIVIKTGPLDRMFDMTKLEVYTSGGAITIRFMEEDRAREIGDSLRARINQYAIDERK